MTLARVTILEEEAGFMGSQQIYSGHVHGEWYKVIQAVAFREGARAGRDGLSYHRHLALVIKVETPHTYS